VVIASGARYRRLQVENLDAFEASNVHYWASPLEAKLCAGQEVVLLGARPDYPGWEGETGESGEGNAC
jgi:thioredoxin reductase (NADPH)